MAREWEPQKKTKLGGTGPQYSATSVGDGETSKNAR